MQCWLSATGSAPTWFTPNFKLKWLKPNPNASQFMGTWFKFQFLMFLFPQIGAAALSWEQREQGCPRVGREGGRRCFLTPSSGFGGIALLLPPSQWMLGVGGDGKPPDLVWWVVGGHGEGRKPTGKAPVLEGKLQNWRRFTKPAPGGIFLWGWGDCGVTPRSN